MGPRPEDSKESPRRGEELSPIARQLQAAQPYVGMVWKLLGGAAVGVLGGMLLDSQFGTKPWGLVGFSVVGISVGFYAFIRAALRMGSGQKQGKRS